MNLFWILLSLPVGCLVLASSLPAGVVGDEDWSVSFSSGRFGPNHAADAGYNNWEPVSNDGGEMIFDGGAIGSTSIANLNYNGGAGTSLRTFKKDNPFGPNPSAAWIIEEQFSLAERGQVGSLTNYDAAGKVAVSFWYRIVTGTAIDPRDDTTVLNLVSPSSFQFSLRFFDDDGNGIDNDPLKDPGNRDITQVANLTGLTADNAWHQLSFDLGLLTPAQRLAKDLNGDNNPDQPTLFDLNIVGDALSPYDVYIDRIEINPVPEPSTYGLLAGALVLTLVWIRRRA